MPVESINAQLAAIQAEPDPNRRNLRVAEMVCRSFRAIGCDPVVVGGSAVEFYSEGRYVSGDVDICFAGGKLPKPREREEIMARLGRSLGVRRSEVAGVLVDVMGWLETTARTPLQQVGELKLIQIEDLIAERLLVATVPARDAARWQVARVLVGIAVAGAVAVDFEELQRVADSPDYRVGAALRELLAELRSERTA